MNEISVSHFVVQEDNGSKSVNLLVEGMHCPSCVAIIESGLKKQKPIVSARLNLTTRRLKIIWKGADTLGNNWVKLIQSMGYSASPFDPNTLETQEKKEEKFLLRCLAVAGFASGNLMLFSIPLWTSSGVEMGAGTRTLFHWVQALIAIPAIAYCGLPFYRSAWRALKEWHTNMDVPISVAVILATFMSLFETATYGRHSYFDSAVMLLFFLLIGRYLDARARGKARGAAHDLLKMMTGFATVIHAKGKREVIPLSALREGMMLLVAAGEKIGADGTILEGVSEVDTSLITGETLPQKITKGSTVFAGMINISAPIRFRVTKAGQNSLLAEIIRLMETAEQSQARYVTIADKISGWYTPVVHALAAATFLGWFFLGHAEWQAALLIAATVLIITCPCALGLAVPVVQVLATGKLMRQGILVKSGSALERLAEITHVAFDKTGTLTLGTPELQGKYPAEMMKLAGGLAIQSKHPLSQAISRAVKTTPYKLKVKEVPGKGLESIVKGKRIRLGRRDWCGVKESDDDGMLELWLRVEGKKPQRFVFADALREDAISVEKRLQQEGLQTWLLSGDRQEAVEAIATQLGIVHAEAHLTPVQKCEVLESIKATGAKLLMVGDGLNDAPSLASAHVSMSPASAMDIAQNAADVVFHGKKLHPVIATWQIAKFSQKLVKQNFLLAIIYNVVAIPLAVAGYVTPLIAAIAMSSSSLVVIGNALRLNLRR